MKSRKKKKVYIVDTSIANEFCQKGNEDKFQYFEKIVKQKLNQYQSNRLVYSIGFMLEVLGFGKVKKRILNINNITQEIVDSIAEAQNEYKVVVDDALNIITSKLESSLPFTPDNLKEKLLSNTDRYNEWYNDKIVPHLSILLSSKNAFEDIVIYLGLEMLQDINYNQNLIKMKNDQYLTNLMTYFYEEMRKPNKNYSIARISSKQIMGGFSKEIQNELSKSKFKPGQDLLDNELVHQSLYGINHQNYNFQADIFTCEKASTIRNRTILYLNTMIYIHYTHLEFRKRNNIYKPYKHLKLNPGVVYHFCSDCGKYQAKTRISEIINSMFKIYENNCRTKYYTPLNFQFKKT